MAIGYTGVKKFDRNCDKKWDDYIKWSGLAHLKEVISLDGILCPNIIRELSKEDWLHNLPDEGMLFCFKDLGYLMLRIGSDAERYNILAVMKNPHSLPDQFEDSAFEFIGYDLIEKDGEISALTNCGGFDNAFRTEDLSEHGLITDYQRVKQVQEALYLNNPNEPHANCDLWAIWKKR